ncbi:MAG: hypothetical protein LBM41_05050 [Ruminococcus sp.]|jgi:hypothetical protein|nr:hypothetical protein [Ruminococcus sp.]
MNDCTNNILNIEVCTNGGNACYQIEIACESGEAVAGAKEVKTGAEFLLPNGNYKVTVTGDIFSSPRMQQRWITIRGCGEGMRFGMTFIFERLRYSNSQPALPVQRRYQEIPKKPCKATPLPMPVLENITTRCVTNSIRNDVYRQYTAPKPPVCPDTPKGRGKRK